jgi:hypothetical protein
MIAVFSIVLLQPFSVLSPFELMSQSSLWLGPFQGLVSAAMGAFFIKAPEEKEAASRTWKPAESKPSDAQRKAQP